MPSRSLSNSLRCVWLTPAYRVRARTTVVKERMDLLELLRKGGMDGDVDFLREALRVLVEGISSRKEDNGGQGKDGPAGAVAQGGNGR